MDEIRKARRMVGMSEDAASAWTGMSKLTYRRREAEQWRFTLRELSALYEAMKDEDARRLILKALDEVRSGVYVA